MSSLTRLMNTAREGLVAQSYGLGVTGQNIANVNTPGYARREAMLETQALGTSTTGSVQAVGLRRVTDAFLERREYESNGLMSAAKQRDEKLASVEALYNDVSGAGLGSSINALFNSFAQLSANPADGTGRQGVLDSADALAQDVNQMADTIAESRADLLKEAQAIAEQVNQNAEAIARLNRQISVAESSGEDAADLKDQRNNLLLDLSSLVDVRTINSGTGGLLVQSSGITLVEGGESRELSIDLATDGSLRVLAAHEGGTPTEVTRFLKGGKLAGIKQARDEDLFDVGQRLDQFVFDLGNSINTQHAAGYGLDGATGRNIFEVATSASGAARALSLSSDVSGNANAIAASGSASSGPGDSSNAAALSALSEANIVFGGTRTAAAGYGDLVGDVATRRSQSERMLESREAIHSQIEAMHQSMSGVSLDEEFVSLTKFQRAYEASARVLSTVDELMQTLLNTLGR